MNTDTPTKDFKTASVESTRANTRSEQIAFYREDETGDYLCVDLSTNQFYLDNLGEDSFEGRATAIANNVMSVCTTEISRRFLDADCTKVRRSDVPAEWLEQFGLAVRDNQSSTTPPSTKTT